MKTATTQELKQELQHLKPAKLTELCLRLARFKKENKELLTYLLFEAEDEAGYISSIQAQLDADFTELPKPNLYLSKKTLRKILRMANRYIRYAGSKSVEASVLLHFCSRMKDCGVDFSGSTVLNNLYEAQLKKIRAAVKTLHEDMQYDLLRELDAL